MWRNIKLVLASLIVSFSVGMTIASSFAQDATGDNLSARTTTTRNDDPGFDLGWIGLAGLAGLLGLMPRDRQVHGAHDIKR